MGSQFLVSILRKKKKMKIPQISFEKKIINIIKKFVIYVLKWTSIIIIHLHIYFGRDSCIPRDLRLPSFNNNNIAILKFIIIYTKVISQVHEGQF